MKKTLAILVCMAMILAISPMALMATYSDMPSPDHWSYAAMNAAVENGLLQGSGGKVLPNDNLTRAQMATILVRAYGATETAADFAFSDVKPSDWFYTNMSIASNKGWFKGSDNKMRPNDPISRQEVFVVLARAIGADNAGSFDLAANFTDASAIASWAADAAAAMAAKGYIKGANGKMNPQNKITRAEFAQLMYNLISAGEIVLPEKDVSETPVEPEKDNSQSSGNNSGGNMGTPSSNNTGNNTNTGTGNNSGNNSGDASNDNDVSDPWGDIIVDGGDNDASDPWGDDTVVPEDKEPSMEDLATSDEGWTGIY